MKAEIIRYISDRYPRWHDLAAYLAEKQYFPELSIDLLHETLVSLLYMDEKKVNKLFEALNTEQDLREIDFYVLRMIRLNAISETAPFRQKFQTSRRYLRITPNEYKLAAGEYDESDEFDSFSKLRHIRLIRAVGETLELTQEERMIFNVVFLNGDTVNSELENGRQRRIFYRTRTTLIDTIKLVLFINGFTKVEPEEISDRVEELAQAFHNRYRIRIVNKNSILEQILIIDSMKRQIYFRDEYSINELNDNLAKAGKVIQEIVTAFSAIGVTVADPKDLANVLDNQRRVIDPKLEQYVFDSLYPETPPGFNRGRYMDIIDLPSLMDLKEAFEPLMGYFGGMYQRDVVEWAAYSINNGQVEILPAERTKLEERFTEVAETPDELNRLAAVQELCKILNKIAELSIEHPATYSLPGVTEYDEKAGKFIPARNYVKIGGRTFRSMIGQEREVESLKSVPGNGPQSLTPDTSEVDRVAAMAKSRNLKVSN